jgi:hypothetical protein
MSPVIPRRDRRLQHHRTPPHIACVRRCGNCALEQVSRPGRPPLARSSMPAFEAPRTAGRPLPPICRCHIGYCRKSGEAQRDRPG